MVTSKINVQSVRNHVTSCNRPGGVSEAWWPGLENVNNEQTRQRVQMLQLWRMEITIHIMYAWQAEAEENALFFTQPINQ